MNKHRQKDLLQSRPRNVTQGRLHDCYVRVSFDDISYFYTAYFMRIFDLFYKNYCYDV